METKASGDKRVVSQLKVNRRADKVMSNVSTAHNRAVAHSTWLIEASTHRKAPQRCNTRTSARGASAESGPLASRAVSHSQAWPSQVLSGTVRTAMLKIGRAHV